MVTYDETMNFKPKTMKWKLSGKSDVSSQHNAECWGCKETKFCSSFPTNWAMNPLAYYCEECWKKLAKEDTATVDVEKANGKS